ncbi:MAG: Hpt domain-containing protein, partial [Bacteroidia bacterium]|nr:Hpt domain-containing protein [Bacteroidia bacterium]
ELITDIDKEKLSLFPSSDEILDRIGVLEYFHGDENILKDLYTRFINGEGERLEAFKQFIKNHKFEDSKKAIHQLKGSAAILGAKRFLVIVTEAEKYLLESHNELAIKAIPILFKEFEDVVTEMKKFLV